MEVTEYRTREELEAVVVALLLAGWTHWKIIQHTGCGSVSHIAKKNGLLGLKPEFALKVRAGNGISKPPPKKRISKKVPKGTPVWHESYNDRSGKPTRETRTRLVSVLEGVAE